MFLGLEKRKQTILKKILWSVFLDVSVSITDENKAHKVCDVSTQNRFEYLFSSKSISHPLLTKLKEQQSLRFLFTPLNFWNTFRARLNKK